MTSNPQSTSSLIDRAGLDRARVNKIVARGLEGADDGEIFLEYRQSEALLATVGLAGYSERQLGALSGGELQRVLLANAMEPVPELLLLDEPATGLDETATKSFEATLLEARRASGATVLMVSHDLAQARRIADRVTILNRTVLRSGPPEAVLSADLAGALLGIAP